MARRNDLDPAAVGDRLSAWLPGVLDGVDRVEVTGVDIPTASGMSSQTVLIDATHDGAPRGFVVGSRPHPAACSTPTTSAARRW